MHQEKKQKLEDEYYNPYLSHLQKPLKPGKTTAAQAEAMENGATNPYTGRPFSEKYKNILKQRRTLPVHKQRQEFLDLIHNNQIVILEGETGSGKTTQ